MSHFLLELFRRRWFRLNQFCLLADEKLTLILKNLEIGQLFVELLHVLNVEVIAPFSRFFDRLKAARSSFVSLGNTCDAQIGVIHLVPIRLSISNYTVDVLKVPGDAICVRVVIRELITIVLEHLGVYSLIQQALRNKAAVRPPKLINI